MKKKHIGQWPKEVPMKKLSLFVLALILLFGMTACDKAKDSGEDMYFISLFNKIEVDGKYLDVPCQVIHYTGGDTYESVYTLPSQVACIDGSRLYYVLDGAVYRVELTTGEAMEYAKTPDESVNYMLADSSAVYMVCGNQLYRVTQDSSECISQNEVSTSFGAPVIGDGALFYIGDSADHPLMRYDISTGQTEQIAENVFGFLSYDSGYIYANLQSCYRIDTASGEKTFFSEYNDNLPHGGWIYYAELFGESVGYIELFRRKPDSETGESCGTAYMPDLGFYTLRYSIDFGKEGFIAHCTKQLEPTEYMYFPYGASEGILLKAA